MNEIITTNHFDRWLENLRDDKALVAIDKRIHKAQFGNFGKVRFITNGIWEMKIDVSGGYRIYYKQVGKITYLLIIGGNKTSQNRDISKALEIIKELGI